mmetsp:Transcript_5909/g.9059  ORF Transcript_5909/g.9059 Transcript_5909/m.9059 type:complete len:962 (+) Transcript_5909:88-2973(+)
MQQPPTMTTTFDHDNGDGKKDGTTPPSSKTRKKSQDYVGVKTPKKEKKIDSGWKNPPESVSPSAKKRFVEVETVSKTVKKTPECKNNRYAALSDDEDEMEEGIKKNWLTEEFPPISEAVDKMEKTVKELKELAEESSDEETSSMYHDNEEVQFDFENNEPSKAGKILDGKKSSTDSNFSEEDSVTDHGTDDEYEWEEEEKEAATKNSKIGSKKKDTKKVKVKHTIDKFFPKGNSTPKERNNKEIRSEGKTITPENGGAPNKRLKDTTYCTPERVVQQKQKQDIDKSSDKEEEDASGEDSSISSDSSIEVNVLQTTVEEKEKEKKKNHQKTNLKEKVKSNNTEKNEGWTISQKCKQKKPTIRPSQKTKAVELTMGDARRYNWRYDFVINISASDDPVKEFRDSAIEFLEKMQQTDKSLIIIPYKTEDYNQGAISKMHKLPDRPTLLKAYFNGMMLKEQGGDIYTSIVLAHNKTFGEIDEDVQFWKKAKRYNIYRRQLAAEKVENLGYFMYSVRSICKEDLKEELWKHGVDAELRWRTMQVADKYIKYQKGKSSPDALQIRVAADKVTKSSNILRQLYGVSNEKNSYLLGIKMRFIPDRKRLVSTAAKGKLQNALIRQLSFINAVKHLTTDDILVLNKPITKKGETLREIILNIPCRHDCRKKIFHSIDKMWNNENKCVITCLPNNAEEAADTLNALIPRLKHEYGKEVLKCFHPDAVMDSATTKWDPVMRVATSPEDEALLRDEESDDEEYNFAPIETNRSLQEELSKHIQGVTAYNNPSCSDSISTFYVPEDQSISSNRTDLSSGSNSSSIGISVTSTENSQDADTISITSGITDMSSDESMENSVITKTSSKSLQSSGQNSDSSDENNKKPSGGGVSFASDKEIRMYEVEEGSLNKKVPKKDGKKVFKAMYTQFKEMLNETSMSTEEKAKLKKAYVSSISKVKKYKKSNKSPSLGKAGME